MRLKTLGTDWFHGLIALVLSVLLLAFAPHRELLREPVTFVTVLLSYPEAPAVALASVFRRGATWFSERTSLLDRLRFLEKENERLGLATHVANAQVQAAKRQLDSALGDSQIVFRAPQAWWTEILIDKGLKDGLRSGTPVLQNGSLVGRTTVVENSFSWVELVTSSSLMVPAVIEETRDLGVVAGDGQGGVWLLFIPESRSLVPGMTVSTAMISEILPPGIPIGRLSEQKKRSDEGFVSYRLETGASLSLLYSVSVLRPKAR